MKFCVKTSSAVGQAEGRDVLPQHPGPLGVCTLLRWRTPAQRLVRGRPRLVYTVSQRLESSLAHSSCFFGAAAAKPQTRWLTKNRNLFLTFLRAGSLR